MLTKSNQKFKPTIDAVFYTYKTIPLRIFIDGDTRAILVSGDATDEECDKAWQSVIEHNNGSKHNLKQTNQLRSLVKYAKLQQDWVKIRSYLDLLLIEGVDKDYIEFLRTKGYKIDIAHGNEAYVASVEAGLQRSNNLVSRMESLIIEINKANENSGGSQKASFEEVMARLMVHYPNASMDITLALYNEFNKVIEHKINALNKQKK